jgi:hypothetical protein
MSEKLDTVLEMLERIETKADTLDQRLDKINVTLAEQAKDLEYHIYRTELLEEHVKKVEQESNKNTEHRIAVTKSATVIISLLTALSLIIGIFWGIVKSVQ